MEVRIGKASSCFSKLRHLWDSSVINRKTKLLLYQSAVVSTLTHCHEVWKLSKQAVAKVGGWNAKCLSLITGKTVREERIAPSFDIIKVLRTRRLRWLGHILRMDEDRLIRKAVTSIVKPYPEGSILMDAPDHDSMADLTPWWVTMELRGNLFTKSARARARRSKRGTGVHKTYN